MGPSAVTAIRMPSDGRRTSGAAVPPEEESEGLCAGALMGTAGCGLPDGGSGPWPEEAPRSRTAAAARCSPQYGDGGGGCPPQRLGKAFAFAFAAAAWIGAGKKGAALALGPSRRPGRDRKSVG